MKTAVCTISTKSHLFKSFALLESAGQYSRTDLFCLVTDTSEVEKHSLFRFNYLADLTSGIAEKLKKKYKGDKLRWSLKPVYVKYLLEQGYDQVIYVDNDIFFYSSPDFLFEKLETSDFLLTPHFYKSNPVKEQNWLEANFRVGLYNAGFFGVSQNAIPVLDWWSECCLYAVEKSSWRGLYDDQKYLDLVPVLFNKVEIVKHPGCNLAGWNDENYTVSYKEDTFFVNGYPVVFIHFAELTMERFRDKNHPLYLLYRQYAAVLNRYNSGFRWRKKRFTKLYLSNVLYYLRWRLAQILNKTE